MHGSTHPTEQPKALASDLFERRVDADGLFVFLEFLFDQEVDLQIVEAFISFVFVRDGGHPSLIRHHGLADELPLLATHGLAQLLLVQDAL